MKVHPALASFPMLSEPEIAALAIEVKRDGLVNPIVRCDGAILDGRARLIACERAKVKPAYYEYTGKDPLGFVLRANAGRSMTPGQRALAAARLYRATEVSGDTSQVSGETSVDRAARVVEALGVPRATLFRAVKLLADGDAGVLEEVERGELRLNEALRRLPSKPKERAAKEKPQYWREPLAEKLRAELVALDARLREACADKMVRTLLEEDLAEFSRKAYSYSDGSAYAREGVA